MSKLKASSISTDGDILKNSESLWIYLKKNAGIDSIFYDRDLLEGNASERGLYGLLGIPKYHDDFEQDLHHYSISVEQLLISFFKTLQPYTLMMSDICGFFERNMIKETNKSLKVVFNFDQAISAGLEFNLDHFRQILEKFTKVKRLINYFHLTHNELWNLIKVFSDDFRES